MSERGRRILGCTLVFLSLCLCAFPALLSRRGGSVSYRSPGSAGPVLREGASERGGGLRVNSADEEELQALPGIGETYAAMIVAERETNGPFYYPEDLTAVRGIGPATVRKLSGLIDLSLDEGGE